jgi:hypothetical protein
VASKERIAASYGYRELQQKLQLRAWQMELALNSGLLVRAADGRFDAAAAAPHLTDPERFLSRLHAEELLNAVQAAAHLHISKPQFKRLVENKFVRARAHGEFRYGVYPLYRRGDLDRVQVFVSDQLAAYAAASAARRAGAGAKAQATRQRNLQAVSAQTQAVQQQLLTTLSIPMALERETAQLAFWTRIVGAHADAAQRASARAHKDENERKQRELATTLFARKDAALRLLALFKNPFVSCSFLDAGRLRLCDECKEECYAQHLRFYESEGCGGCRINHHYSLVEVKVVGGKESYLFTIPYPLVSQWLRPQNASNEKRIEGSYRQRRSHPPREELMPWVRKLPRFEREGGIGAYDERAQTTLLRAFPSARALESLEAALANLKETLRVPIPAAATGLTSRPHTHTD